ncbi:MAG: hypothetical protein MUD14_25135 [Hydrococcus sp. Prado102]|nr:hypothetical protein [Hydrococcus sp. Prado102]
MSIASSTTQRKRISDVKKPTHSSRDARSISETKVKQLPLRSRQLSQRARSLLALQKISSGVAFCLVASALGVYAWSVCVPRLWSQESKKLETLQRHERHLTAMSETLKNQLAQQAERPETGLAKLNPAQVIFLSPSSVPPLNQPQTTATENQPIVGNTPLAY